MKIALVFDDSLDRPDGVQQYLLALAAWLRQQGHDVHFLVGQTGRRDVPNVHSLARNVSVTFNGNRLSVPLPASKKQLRALLERERFDVLHVQLPCSPWLAGRIVRLAPPGTRVVGTFHILPFSRLEQAGGRGLALLSHNLLKRFNAVCSVSAAAQAYARAAFGLDSVVIPNVVDTSFYRRAPRRQPAGKKSIVFLGRLVPRKGCAYLLRAIRELHAQRTLHGVAVTICGDGPLRSSLQQFVDEYDLRGIVQFAGYVSESQKRDFLAGADVAVFPSLGGESFGIVLIEAMAAGAGAVLGGDNPGYRSVLGEQPELLIDPRDTAAFAERLDSLLHNAGLRQRVHAWQSQAVKHYDVASVGRQLMVLYTGKQ